MMEPERHYLPAAGRHAFLPFYDPFTKVLGLDKTRRALLEQAELQPGHRVLDVGCGTGSLLVLIKRRHPEVDVVGLDPDPKALARARRKAQRAAVTVSLDQGFADALPYGASTFDRVFSSFMFHHLERDDKLKALSEMRRVLKPGGRFEMMDFAGRDHAGPKRIHRWLHSHERFEDNSENRVLELMTQAAFAEARAVGRGRMLFGGVVYYEARRPDQPSAE